MAREVTIVGDEGPSIIAARAPARLSVTVDDPVLLDAAGVLIATQGKAKVAVSCTFANPGESADLACVPWTRKDDGTPYALGISPFVSSIGPTVYREGATLPYYALILEFETYGAPLVEIRVDNLIGCIEKMWVWGF